MFCAPPVAAGANVENTAFPKGCVSGVIIHRTCPCTKTFKRLFHAWRNTFCHVHVIENLCHYLGNNHFAVIGEFGHGYGGDRS